MSGLDIHIQQVVATGKLGATQGDAAALLHRGGDASTEIGRIVGLRHVDGHAAGLGMGTIVEVEGNRFAAQAGG